MVLASQAAYENSLAEDAQVAHDKNLARSLTIRELALLPFTGLAGLLRFLVMKLVSLLLLNR